MKLEDRLFNAVLKEVQDSGLSVFRASDVLSDVGRELNRVINQAPVGQFKELFRLRDGDGQQEGGLKPAVCDLPLEGGAR